MPAAVPGTARARPPYALEREIGAQPDIEPELFADGRVEDAVPQPDARRHADGECEGAAVAK